MSGQKSERKKEMPPKNIRWEKNRARMNECVSERLGERRAELKSVRGVRRTKNDDEEKD